jgi:hypothetical protein
MENNTEFQGILKVINFTRLVLSIIYGRNGFSKSTPDRAAAPRQRQLPVLVPAGQHADRGRQVQERKSPQWVRALLKSEDQA